MKKKKIARALQDLTNRFNLHVGAGDKEHLPADKDHAGFFTPNLLEKLMMAIGYRKIVDEGTDILKLEPGKYAGINFKNSTLVDNDSGWVMVDVNKSNDSYIEFKEVHSFSGRTFFRNIHKSGSTTNAGAASGWTEFVRTVPLWQGSVTKTGTNLTLLDDCSKFSYVKITADNGNANIESKILKRIDTVNFTSTNLIKNSVGDTKFSASINFNKKQATLVSNFAYVNTEAGYTTLDQRFNILAIEGVI
ncbi:hypothetical protein AAHB41_09140 [Pediococcus pentosaceus]|uniref:hypothetical protein n=1 Tax=Pediococcus pentosaceus TaxID=1255 RepID=UPI002FF04C84